MTDAANAEGILLPAEIENAVEDSDQPEEGVTTEATAENTTEEAQEPSSEENADNQAEEKQKNQSSGAGAAKPILV